MLMHRPAAAPPRVPTFATFRLPPRLTGRRSSLARRDARPDGPPSLPKSLWQFTAAGVVAMLVLGAAGTTILRRDGVREALREARVLTRVQEQAVRPHLTDALLRGDPAAVADLDQAVRSMVLAGGVERVKVWSGDGHVLYADDRRLVGTRFSLGPDELRTLRTGVTTSDLSDLSAAENQFDPTGHRLLEVYVRTQTTSGQPLLFESYLRYDGVVASANRIWTDFAPALLATLVALQLLQLPLAGRLIRRLQRGQRERDLLHDKVMRASDAERQRIAGDLHDGVVQTLAGVSYSLAAAAVDVRRSSPDAAAAAASTISEAAGLTRRSVGELRSLIVDIYPPNLREVGLQGALANLVAALPARGLVPQLSVGESVQLPPAVEELLYRAAQEAVRNVLTHAGATSVRIDVWAGGGRSGLRVRDDGRGFVVTGPEGRGAHFGLRLLDEMARNHRGSLTIDSVPGLGTTLLLEVPLP